MYWVLESPQIQTEDESDSRVSLPYTQKCQVLETDRQTDTQTDKHVHTQTNGHTQGTQINTQTDGHTST
jgi:hypothetical protein